MQRTDGHGYVILRVNKKKTENLSPIFVYARNDGNRTLAISSERSLFRTAVGFFIHTIFFFFDFCTIIRSINFKAFRQLLYSHFSFFSENTVNVLYHSTDELSFHLRQILFLFFKFLFFIFFKFLRNGYSVKVNFFLFYEFRI